MNHSHEFAPLLGGCFGFFFVTLIAVIAALIYCKIFSKAGYHWAMGLLMMIPVANLIMLLVLAFGEWPIEREVKALRAATGQAPTPQGFRSL
jgi:apolipoprotein N-acyltransferase